MSTTGYLSPKMCPRSGSRGDESVIQGLLLDNETVLAFVAIAYSTGQGRGNDGDQTVQEGPFLHDRLTIDL
jgi:hypothetical protein